MIVFLLSLWACTPLPQKDEVFDPDGDAQPWGQDCDNGASFADEVPYDGVDNDCDASTPDDDLDEDGYGAAEDCDDGDPAMTPSATDVVGDGLDQNCDGLDGLDADGDGHASEGSGGDDCDDGNVAMNPGNTEIEYNGTDDDCDASTPDDDLDGDGYDLAEDCDDTRGAVYPGAAEICDDGLVNDCGGDAAGALAECGRAGDLSLASSEDSFWHPDASAQLGYSLAAGDFDGDGLGDLALGARRVDGAGTDHGAAYLLLDSDIASGDVTVTASASYAGPTGYGFAGFSLAALADFDGQGCADLAIGAAGNGGGGTVYLITDRGAGGAHDLSSANLRILDEDTGSLGSSLAHVADISNDGLSELAVGSTAYDNRGTENAGAAYVFLGTAAGGSIDTSDAHAQYVGVTAGAEAGYDLASCDLYGTGAPELVVGAPNALNSDDVRTGGVYIANNLDYPGTWSLDEFSFIAGEGDVDQAGLSVACGGDNNGDGRQDLLVGAPYNGAGDEGAAYLIYGGGTQTPRDLGSADARLTGVERGDEAGFSVAFAGDIDGDEQADALVGARYVGSNDAGRVYVVLATEMGGSSSLGGVQMRIDGEAAYAYAGWSVAPAGDIDGNGLGDVLIGASGASRAYLFNPGF